MSLATTAAPWVALTALLTQKQMICYAPLSKAAW
jgi:hypothetical protein